MSVPTAPLILNSFAFANNDGINSGYILISLYPSGGKQDSSNAQLQGNQLKVFMDSLGVVSAEFPIATYVIYVYTAKGQLVGGPVVATN